MGSSYLTNPLVFLIQVLFGAYIFIVMLRFLLQLVRADFHNPISQFTVKATTPVLRPLRRFIPGMGGIDIASIILMLLLLTVQQTLVMLLSGQGVHLLLAFAQAIPELVSLFINFFLFAILLQVILSWVSPGNYNPAIALLGRLTDPLLGPARRIIPALGGLDLSPMVVMIGLTLLKMLLIPPLYYLVSGLPLG